jgi:hypothetical protein
MTKCNDSTGLRGQQSLGLSPTDSLYFFFFLRIKGRERERLSEGR